MSKLVSFQVGKRTFVGGLFWQLLVGPTNSHDTEAALFASQINADLGVFRNGAMRQVGLCASGGEIKPGMSSAAAVISKTVEVEHLGNNALVATRLPNDLYLLVVIENGEILPEGDVVGEESDIHNQLYTVFAQATWDTVIAPGHWGVSGALERNFESFLPTNFGKGYSWWNLIPVGTKALARRRSKRILIALAGAGLVMAGSTGVMMWQKHQAEEAARLQQEALAREQAEADRKSREVRAEKPWIKKPSAVTAAQHCESAILAAPLAPGGWVRESMVCDLKTQGVLATFKRNRSQIGFLPTAIGVDFSGETGTYSASLGGLSPGGEEAPLSAMDARRIIQSNLQSLGLSGALVVIPPPPPPPPQNGKPAVVIEPDWTGWTFAISTGLRPTTVIETINMPTLRINKIQSGGSGATENQWLIEGEVYARK